MEYPSLQTNIVEMGGVILKSRKFNILNRTMILIFFTLDLA